MPFNSNAGLSVCKLLHSQGVMASSTIKRKKKGSEQQLIPTGGIGMEGSTKIQRSRNLHFRAFRGPGDHPPSTTTVTGFSMTFSFNTGQNVMATDAPRESRRASWMFTCAKKKKKAQASYSTQASLKKKGEGQGKYFAPKFKYRLCL